MWIKLNNLKMNIAKAQLMVLNRKNEISNVEQVQVSIEGTGLNKQSCVKLVLGVCHRQRTHLESTCKPPARILHGKDGFD